MESKWISQVSKQYHISARTLRYYEQLGLITPERNEDNSYRTYSEETLCTLHQIIVLRKLRIPLKQIAEILKSDSAKAAIEIFEENLSKIEAEITALSTIRDVIQALIDRLMPEDARFMLADEEALFEIVDSLTIDRPQPKEEKNMEKLEQANEELNQLTERSIRYIYIPPATVASAHFYGDGAEERTGEMIDTFARSIGLCNLYPASRHFGFNWPDPVDETGTHGYERWITIPDDLTVPSPLVKKRFDGGLFAAHMIPMGAFEEWGPFFGCVSESKNYEIDISEHGNGYHSGLFEEHLNWINYHTDPNYQDERIQLDLLIAVKEK